MFDILAESSNGVERPSGRVEGSPIRGNSLGRRCRKQPVVESRGLPLVSAPTTTFDPSLLTTDGLERLLTLCEAEIGRLRGIQSRLIREAQARQLPCADGARTLVDWISSRLDINPETAQALQRVACSGTSALDAALDTGASFDRVAECARTGDTDLHLELDLPGLRRLQARRHRVTRRNEADAYARRHLIIQPDLFDTSWTLRGLLPALEGAVVSQVLDHLADTIPDTRGVTPDPRHARRADALVQLCTQGATSASDDASPIPVTTTVVVDARETHRGDRGMDRVRTPRRSNHPRTDPVWLAGRSHRHHLRWNPAGRRNGQHGDPAQDPALRSRPRWRVRHRRLHLGPPSPTSPHHTPIGRRRQPPSEPRLTLLVPPSRRRPQAGVSDRPREPAATAQTAATPNR